MYLEFAVSVTMNDVILKSVSRIDSYCKVVYLM